MKGKMEEERWKNERWRRDQEGKDGIKEGDREKRGE